MPDWRALVLAHLTDTDPTTGDLDAVDNTDGWRLAYATLMATRGRLDPPELVADLSNRVDELDKATTNHHKAFIQINEITDDNLQDMRRRLARLERTVTTAEGATDG